MLKAGTLFYSVVISLVIALLSGSVIMLSGMSTASFNQSLAQQNLEMNVSSGLNLLLSKQSIVGEDQELQLDLYGNGTDSISLSRKYWGAYEIIIADAFHKGNHLVKIAESGFVPDSSDNYCLYVSDHDKPIAVCGETKIKGKAFLPKAGIKRAYIEGHNYTGSSLIYGEIRESEKTLPVFNKSLLKRIMELTGIQSSESSNVSMNENEPGENFKIENSFLNATQIISSGSVLGLNECFSGNIMIVSKSKITVNAEAQLKDVILYAPQIIIKKGFKGNLQAFASDSILVEENVSLSYPSVLGVVQSEKSSKGSCILLSAGDTISGNVFAYGNDASHSLKQTGISASEKTVIYGKVYSNGYADIKGKIFGSLMCYSVLLRTGSAVYENHFLNAVIDRSLLSKHYVGINLVEESSHKDIVKWLK